MAIRRWCLIECLLGRLTSAYAVVSSAAFILPDLRHYQRVFCVI
jgi:hypothetical protein